MKRLFILTIFSLSLAICIFFFKKRMPTTLAAGEGLTIPKEWLDTNRVSITPLKDRRPADQTFLTYPEWFLVFSPEEQAAYFKHTTSSTFPYMAHTAQIWQSYKIVNDQIKDNFPVNKGYHFMIWVIGTSASAEYMVKAGYETLIGRLTDTHEVLSEEDQFNYEFNQAYVDFIKDRPWYEFNFKEQMDKLWGETPVFGSNILRKLERRYILTSELAVKYVYGKLIGMGTQGIYGAALPTTAVVYENEPVKRVIEHLPRYDKFNAAARKLAEEGYTFKEIAGNSSAILLTVLAPVSGRTQYDNAQTIFVQPLASNKYFKRVAITVPVPQLHTVLNQLRAEHTYIEHIFDF